jgi:lipopolysaccharide/colanic/teichoic acid biosynthesis glycosyltransferase
LIGPRPLVPNEAEEHEDWHLKRLSVKPGITCTWQIKPERNSVPFDEWMELDNHYVDNWSIFYDIKIFFGTIRSFFKGRGI